MHKSTNNLMEQFEDCKVTSPTNTKASSKLRSGSSPFLQQKNQHNPDFTPTTGHSIWAPDASFQDAKTAIRIGQYLDLLSQDCSNTNTFSGQQVRKHKEIIWEKMSKNPFAKIKTNFFKDLFLNGTQLHMSILQAV